MILIPVFCNEGLDVAVSVIAPPAACKIREKISQLIKVIVYVRGEKRERFSPYTTTIRARHR